MTWRSTLKSACIVGNLNTVKSLVGKHDLDEECDYLFWAALYGREEIVEFLIEYGVDVNIKLTEYLYECALHTAIAKGHVNVVRILVEKGADVNVVDRYGSTPLMLAAKRGYLEMVQFLIDHGARINAMNNQGCTVLMLATEHQYWEMVSFLIEHGAGVNAVDCYGRIPLMFAAECQHWEMVSFLTKHGATVNVVDRKGHTPLMLAAERGHWKTVSFLINHGARVNVLDKNGCTPLMLAAKGGHWDIVSFLLEHGASAQGKLKDKLSRTPLHCVANSCSVNIIAKLVSLGANVNAQDDNSVTPLMKAVEKGYFDTVSFLIRHGADVKLKDNRGRTALHFIRYGKADKIIELLVTSGANIDEEDNGMQTPLQTSILTAISCSCYSSVPCIFVEHGANVTRLSPSQGGMLVCCCIHCKYFDLTHSMVTAGVSIGVKNGECVNPLVLASQNGHDSLVKALILAGVNVNLKDTIGYTALHWAARKQHIQCGVLLAQAGSDLSIRNYRGKTALELASKVFNLSIQAALSFTTKRTVCVIGNACSGKSTLIASLQNENESFLNKCKHWLFGVEEIRNRTAGIDPISFISHKYGNVVFFDFAGQHEYHGPHEMFMESLFNQRGSTVTIIVVAKATEEESVITQQLERWLHPLRKLSSSSTNPIRVIVAGSFMDQVEAQSTAQEKVENCYQSLKKSYSEVPVTFQGLCFLNCRQPYSSGFADLCQYLQEVPVLQVQANTTYSLCWVSSQMKTLIVKDKALRLSSFAKWIDDNKGNLPKNMPSADDVCKDLSSTGHYLYLPNKEEPLNSWLVLDLPAILHEVYGTLFSRSKKIVNEFGLLSVQELGNLFSSLDVGMICDVLIAMDFCIEVDPVILKEEILKLTSDTSECHDFLFFPALVSLKRPKVFENTQPDHVCHTLCWQFQANPNHFISPRLIQTIILRLSSLHVLHCADTRQHYCSVWWNGLSWPTLTGVVIAVQISNNAVIQVIGRSTTDPNDLCRYLSWITRDIKSTIAQINPSLSGCAYIIHGVDPEVLLSDPSSPFPHEMYPLSIVLESTRTGKTSCFSSKPSPGQARVKRISEVFCGTCPSEDVVELMYYDVSERNSSSEGNIATTCEPPTVHTHLPVDDTPTGHTHCPVDHPLTGHTHLPTGDPPTVQTPPMSPDEPLLTTPTLNKLDKWVIPHIALDWYSVGKDLEVEESVLKRIEQDTPNNVHLSCYRMFSRWLSVDEGTGGSRRLWKTVLMSIGRAGYASVVGDVERALSESTVKTVSQFYSLSKCVSQGQPMDSVIHSTSDLLPYMDMILPHLKLLGLVLDIEDYTKAVVEGPGNLKSKCIDILQEWLKRTPKPTWRVFCKNMERSQEFNKLRSIICTGKQ